MALPKVFDELNKRLPLTGGAMTGALTLNGDPVANLQAVTKQYIDNQIAGGVVAEAGKLSVNAGSTTKPIYFDQGVPKVVGNTIDVNISGAANKVNHSLHFTVGGTDKGSYDGSSEHIIYVNAYDLNIQGALQYIGRTNIEPTTANITLIDGSNIIAQPGNVVIYTENNIEYLYDTSNTWIPLGEVTNYALTPHIHGNISSKGYLTNSSGLSLSRRLLTSDGTGAINGATAFSNVVTDKFLNENGTWQAVSTFNNKIILGNNSGILQGSEDLITLGASPTQAVFAGTSAIANKLAHALTIDGQAFDGSSAMSISINKISADPYKIEFKFNTGTNGDGGLDMIIYDE